MSPDAPDSPRPRVSRRALLAGGGVAAGAALLGAARAGGVGTTAGSLVEATSGPRGTLASSTTTSTTAATTTTTTTAAPTDRLAAFRGYGAWWDAYDWSPTFAALKGRAPSLFVPDVDRAAAAGVQTLYIQSGHHLLPTDLADEAMLTEIVGRARGHGMHVVAWYVPTHQDQARDLARLEAPLRLGVDGVGVDAESQEEPDVAVRTTRLIWISEQFAARNPDAPFAMIPNPPILYDEINLTWWPGFPYRELVPFYDLWMPMAYWTQRKEHWRDAGTWIRENVIRLRVHTGVADLVVHPIGGLAEDTTVAEVQAMGAVMRETGCIGGSLYDEPSTPPSLYDVLRAEFTR